MPYPALGSKLAFSDGTSSTSIAFDEWYSAAEQRVGDLFMVVAHQDSGSSALSLSGWTEIAGPAPTNSASRTAVFYIFHTGTTIAAPTVTSSTSSVWSCCAQLFRDVDTTTPFDVTEGVTDQTTSTSTPTCPSITTVTDNCFIVRILGRDGQGTHCITRMPFGQGALIARNTERISGFHQAACSIYGSGQPTAGATGTFEFTDRTSDGGRQLTIALRNRSGGKTPGTLATNPTVDTILDFSGSITPPATLLSNWHSTIIGNTVRADDISGGALINSTQTFTDFAALGQWGQGRNLGQNQISTTSLAGIYGAAFTLDSDTDFSNSLFYTQIDFNTSPQLSSAGQMIYFRDSAGGWAVIRPYNRTQGGNFNYSTFLSYLPDEVQIDGSGDIDWSIIRYVGVASDSLNNSNSGQRIFYIRNILALPLSSPFPFVGGVSGRGFDFRDITDYLDSGFAYRMPVVLGVKQNLVGNSIQIGDGGTTTTHFDGNSTTLEFVDNSYTGIRIRPEDLELRIKLGASDTFALGAATIASGTKFKFTIDPASSLSATYGFRGTIVNALVTLLTGLTVANCTFQQCSEIDAKGAILHDCSIEGTTSTDAAIVFDTNSSMNGTSISLNAGTSAQYHLELGSSVTEFTLTDVTLSGTPGTNKVHVKATSGTVTITLAGSTSLVSGDITSDGATVVLVTPSIGLYVNGLWDETRVVMYNETEDTVIYDANISGASISGNSLFVPYTEGVEVTTGDTIRVYYVWYNSADGSSASKKGRATIIPTATGGSATIEMELCDVYDSYYNTFGVTGKQVYDSGDYVRDLTNLQIDLDDDDDTWYAHRMFMWDKYDLWLNSGRRAVFSQVTAFDTGNINIGILLLDNVNANTAYQGDEINVINSTSTLPVQNPTTGGGGITMYSGGKILTTSSSGITPSEAQIKTWVREEFQTEMEKITKIDKVTKLIPAAL